MMQAHEPREVLTFEEVRDRLRVGRTTLFRLVAEGEIESFRIGRSRRFVANDVEAFIQSRRQSSVVQ
jgi:excisionase family DNA binding protein